uniref:Small ribosomal subunit protein uS3m n=2 Tax=Podocarpaceae TaxID=3362 RepID=D2DX37_9CONI|nr:ribosomal protein S3 [Dacrycarpus imbricatus]
MSPFLYNNYVNPKILLFLLNRRKQQRNLNEILLFPNRSNLAQKVNPISVRLHLNRSSDSSWFSDHYYGKLVYQDVNLRDYFGSIRPPTRINPFGFRLGRCILHHSPKRTFIHLFLPRRPPLNSSSRGGQRGRSGPGKRRWAIEKGESIGIGLLKGDGTEERRGLGAGETVVRSMRLDDRSRVIWRAKQRYEYHDRSPPYCCNKGRGNISKSLRVSGLMAHKPMSFSNQKGFYGKCFKKVLFPRRIRRLRLLLQTIPAVRPYSNYLVMRYLFRLENPLHTKPVACKERNLNHFVAPDSSLYGLQERIRFVVEGLTKTRFAGTTRTPGNLDRFASVEPSPSPLPLVELTLSSRRVNLMKKVEYLTVLGYRASSECCDHYSSDRSSLFPLFFGATFSSLRENLRVRVGGRGFQQIGGARTYLLWRSKKKIFTHLLRRSKEILRKHFHTYIHKGSGSVKKVILGRIGGVMRGIEMMLEIRLRGAGIPYGYNYYLNEVQKMRSLLSGRTNTNTFIGSVKIKSVYQSASLIAQDISFRLRDRKSFRSIFYELVRDIPLVMLKRVGGIRICCSGRLKGAEIARTECMEYGKTSCNAFRHRIDYASAKVSTRYGILGVKVWISFL